MDANNSLLPLEDLIVTGLGQRYQQLFKTSLLVSNAPNKKKAYENLRARNPEIKLPFSIASFQNFTIPEQGSYGASPLMRRGLTGSATHDNMQAYNLSLLPVTTTYKLTVFQPSLEDCTRFAKRWLFAAMEGSMKFTIKYAVADIDIHVDLDRSIDIPDSTDGLDTPSEYELSATFRVQGYMAKNPKRVQAATEVEVSAVVVEKGGMRDAVRNVGATRTETFKFNRSWENE